MGTTSDQLNMIIGLHKNGHFTMPARIADIGCQVFTGDTREASRRFLAHFGGTVTDGHDAATAANRFTGHLFTAAGFEYRSFDVVDAPFCERLDLNTDAVPKAYRGQFDLVLNFGTTEHVMNQYNAMRILHDFAKPGGLVYTMFLMNGYQWHGVIRYTVRFIDMLVSRNEYEVLHDSTHDQTYSEWRRGVGKHEPEENYYRDMCRWMVLKKTQDQPFREIVDA